MEMVFVYGGFILTAGTFDGRAWQGVNVMLAEVNRNRSGGFDAPVVARVFKASRSNAVVMDALNTLVPGDFVTAFFSMPDSQGRVKLASLAKFDA